MTDPSAERSIREATWIFASGHMGSLETVEWALGLPLTSETQRDILRELFDRERDSITAAYRAAWRWVFESWSRPAETDRYEQLIYLRRAKDGALTQDQVDVLLSGIRPWIKVETYERIEHIYGPRTIVDAKSATDIVHISVSSHEYAKEEIRALIENLDDESLTRVVLSLNSAVISCLISAREAGLISSSVDASIWQVKRAYFVPPNEYPEGGNEPDQFTKGFAPSTKVLAHAVARLKEENLAFAKAIVGVWRTQPFSLMRRLWAAASRDPSLSEGVAVSEFLLGLSNEELWRVGSFPEYAELRARRWADLSDIARRDIEKRLRRGRPQSTLSTRLSAEEKKEASERSAQAELQRIEAAGGTLSAPTKAWLASNQYRDFQVNSVVQGFSQGPRVTWGHDDEPAAFKSTKPEKLLPTLERAIGTDAWSPKARAAFDHIAANGGLVVDLLAELPDAGATYPRVWNALGHRHRLGDENKPLDEERLEAARITSLLLRLPKETLENAIEGVSEWIGNWSAILGTDDLSAVWAHVWPVAVVATNASDDLAEIGLKSLNSPAGKLVGAFLSACPSLKDTKRPFAKKGLADMRDALSEATGSTKEQVNYRLIENIGYFVAAAPAWASKNILKPLSTSQSASDWEAFSRLRSIETKIMSIVASQLATIVSGSLIAEETKAALTSQAIWHSLLAAETNANSAFADPTLQQMLRMGGNVVRVAAVEAFASYLEASTSGSPSDRFDKVVGPIFERIWPKEITLTSRPLSKALAGLPASALGRFKEAVDLVLPYISPFDCWSLWDFGMLQESASGREIVPLKSDNDAFAFLALLDRSVGGDDGAVIPHDLEVGLQAIVKQARKAERDVRYQRLLTLARR